MTSKYIVHSSLDSQGNYILNRSDATTHNLICGGKLSLGKTTNPTTNYDLDVAGNTIIGGTTTLNDNVTVAAGKTLTVDTNTLHVDATNNRLGLGTTSPLVRLDVIGAGDYNSSTPAAIFRDSVDRKIAMGGIGMYRYDYNGPAAMMLNYLGYQGGTTQFRSLGIYDGKTSQIAHFDGATGYVGVGTATPISKLHIHDAGDVALLTVSNSDGFSGKEFIIQHFKDTHGSYPGIWMWNRANSPMMFATNNAERLRITSAGNVGIGTTAPLSTLHVVGASAVSVDMGVGGTMIEHRRSSDGWTMGNIGWVYAGSYGGHMTFNTNYGSSSSVATEKMRINHDGKVGIGTTTPLVPLHVTGAGGNLSTSQAVWFSYNHTAATLGAGPAITRWGAGGNQAGTITAYFVNTLAVSEYILSHAGTLSASDERIKENIVDVHDNESLERLRQLKPKHYTYQDVVQRGTEPTIGFIAQEVAQVIPGAVGQRTDTIPNIYKIATVGNFISDVGTNITFGDDYDTSSLLSANISGKLKLMDKNGIEMMAKLVSIIDGKNFTIEEDISDKITAENKIFVYGQEVTDFNFVRKDTIWTVATAALQEVDRQLQAEKTKTANLETKVSTLETELAAIKAHIGL